MAILITPEIVNRAAARFFINEQSDAEGAGAPGEEAHIYNLYEEFSMPLSDIVEIARLGLQGKLENVQEKMDGQFLAFTVVDGQLRFFTKMDLQGQAAKDKKLNAIQSGGKGGGMTLDEIMETYTGGRSNIAEGFAIAYEALEPVALVYQDSLFRNGEVVMASQIMVSKNPNTILYNNDSLRTVLAISLTSVPVDQDALSLFKAEMRQASTEAFTMDEVPTAKLLQGLEQDDKQIEQLEKDLESVVGEVGMSIGSNTVGDYINARLDKFIRENYSFIPDELVPEVADRFMTGKGKIALRLKKIVSQEDYQKFRDLDKVKPRVVQEAIIPLEGIIQRLGVMIINKLDLALTASNQEELLEFIKHARESFDNDKILGDEKTLEGIRVALARLEENEDLFTTATEGIVFTYNNKTYKLTGLFTPINKLRGFFGKAMGREGFGKATLPEQSLKIESVVKRIRLITEGGNAFKDSEGNRITRLDRMPREIVQPIIQSFTNDILKNLGVDSVGVGTTVSTSETVGDLDFVIEALSNDEVYRALSSIPLLQDDLPQAPGVDRLYKLPGGAGVAVLYYAPTIDDLVQVDIMPSLGVDLKDISWMLSGANKGGVKSRYKNILLSWIAKNKSEKESLETGRAIKYTYARGLLKKIDGTPASTGRVTDPDIFLPMLGISASKEDIPTFETLVDEMRKDPFLSSLLPLYRSYLDNRNHLQSPDPQRRRDAEEAMEYIDRNKVDESFREIIRQLLAEGETVQMFSDPGTLDTSGRKPKIDYRWLNENSVEDPLYDHASKKLYPAGFAALLKGMTSEAADKERNEGEKFEHGIIEYAKEIGAGEMKRVGGEGEDLQGTSGAVQGRSYELKKTKESTPNLKLNASFPKSKEKHYYMFVTNLPLLAEIKAGMAKLSNTGKDFETFEGELDELNDFIQEIKYFTNTLGKTERESIVRRAKERLEMSGRQQALPLPDRETNIISEAESSHNSDTVDRFIALIDTIGKKNYDSYGESDAERLKVIDSLEYRGKISKKNLEKQITQKLDGSQSTTQLQKELTKVFKTILGDLRCWIVPSITLRLSILSSAFKGGEGKIFDRTTGELLPGGKEYIEEQLRDKFNDLNLSGKLAAKISPSVINQVQGEDTKKKESEWDIRLGLLKVRVSLKIEPPTVKGDD